MDNETQPVVISEKPADKSSTWKIFIAIITVLSIAVLVYVKLQNPEFVWKWFYIIAGIITVIGGGLFFGFTLFAKVKTAVEAKTPTTLPKMAKTEVIKQKVLDEVSSLTYQNHVKRWVSTKKHIGLAGDTVYVFEIEPEYKEITSEVWFVIINAHFIDDIPTVLTRLTLNKNNAFLVSKSVNKSFVSPEKEHSKSLMKLWNPVTQTYQEIESDNVETTKPTKAIKKEQDLA